MEKKKKKQNDRKNEKISFDSVCFVKFCLVGCSVVVGYAFSMFVLTLASHSSSFGSLVPPLPLPTPPPPTLPSSRSNSVPVSIFLSLLFYSCRVPFSYIGFSEASLLYFVRFSVYGSWTELNFTLSLANIHTTIYIQYASSEVKKMWTRTLSLCLLSLCDALLWSYCMII